MSKVCIVTGASQGLGRGIAHVLATEEGAKVYATARNLDLLGQLAEDVAKSKGEIIPYRLDQSDDKSSADFVNMVADKEAGIDLLVNSSYGGLTAMTPYFGKPFWERPISVFDASINIGLRSAYVMSSLVSPHMVNRGSGLLVQVSSLGGYHYLFDVGYGVGKAGLDRLTTDMAAELLPHGIRAITLYPGGAKTEIASFPDGETPTFSGRSVATLLNRVPSKELDKMNGKVIQTMELAIKYGFTDASGELPVGPFSSKESAENSRKILSATPIQYNLDAELPNSSDTNNKEVAGFFPGA